MTEPRCELCKHWRAIGDKREGHCRAHPPIVQIGRDGIFADSYWPVVGKYEACGEFAKKVVKRPVVEVFDWRNFDTLPEELEGVPLQTYTVSAPGLLQLDDKQLASIGLQRKVDDEEKGMLQ